jgi:hypothetical protein
MKFEIGIYGTSTQGKSELKVMETKNFDDFTQAIEYAKAKYGKSVWVRDTK